MILFYAILIIVFESITEALVKRHFPDVSAIIFKWWVQWLIAGALFVLWLLIALNFDKYYVPTWKLITGFIFVRFMIFDIVYNLTSGLKWNYYGTTKFYDRFMARLGGYGWWVKLCLGFVGICFLIGLS